MVSARTRLFVSLTDEQVLTQVGDHLGSLLCSDLATRCRLGAGPKYLGRAKRKRVLTSRCSSRWAGAITRTTDDMWERELLNLEDLEYRDRKELAELDRRLALSVGKGKEEEEEEARVRDQRGALPETAPPPETRCQVVRHRTTSSRGPSLHSFGWQETATQQTQPAGRRYHLG